MVAAPRASYAPRDSSVTSIGTVRGWRGRCAKRAAADGEMWGGRGDDEGNLARLGLTLLPMAAAH